MNKFIKHAIFFALPIVALGVLAEILLRKIPNEYLYKRNYLDSHADSIKVLFLGSSHAYYDINPEIFSEWGFNASHISQTLEYDFEILKRYRHSWHDLECIAIPISYFSFFTWLGEDAESWRVKNYNIYYEMSTSSRLTDYSEVLGNQLKVNWGKIHAYYIRGNPYVNCSNLGWGLNYRSSIGFDLKETGEKRAKQHTKNLEKYYNNNTATLESIIKFAHDEGVKILLYTPPAYQSYIGALNRNQLDLTINTVKNMDGKYQHVAYINFLSDTTFTAADFFDGDHLNEKGAKKLTTKIDSLINRREHETWQTALHRDN